jgi:hypothetical protein
MAVRKQLATGAVLLAVLALFAPTAQASLGYEPDASTPVISVQGEQPQGVAIDQSSQRVYVAIPANSVTNQEFGHVLQLESNGAPTAASPFRVASQALFSGVAVNPITHGIYASEFIASTPFGNFGASQIDQFSSAGTLGTQFATGNGPGVSPEIATDSSGNVYYPNAATDTVQVFDPSGTLLETITCGTCPGGGFDNPSGVAFDSADNLYVVDLDNDRVVKFTHPGGSYAFSSVLQSGRNAAAVAVDTSDNSVFVGDTSGAADYHIVAYTAAGVQFDDFGGGLFATPPVGRDGAGSIAANATTHKLYVSDSGANVLRVFSRVTINPPSATTNAASPVGQIQATLNATVNANFHATSDCHFEYTDDADFLAHDYTNAIHTPCSSLPNGSQNTAVSATLSPLAASTTYHYRVAATNNAGTTNGASQTFTTLAVTPATATTEAASEIQQKAATLKGKVNPHGGSVSNCHFEYGVDLTYGTSVSCPTAVGPVSSDVAESIHVASLSPSTTYHYRLFVTTNAGAVNGEDRQFTTATPPPPPEEPPVSEPGPTTAPQQEGTLPVVVAPSKKLHCKKNQRKARVHGKLRCVKRKHRRH